MNPMPFLIRAATQSDEPHIKAMIRQAQLYPLGIQWQRFIVAEEGDAILGVVQLKKHWGGAFELGSLAVIPSRQKEGIGAKLVEELLAKAAAPVYLDCHISRESYYQRFGFRRLTWQELPFDFRLIRLFLWLVSPFAHLATRGNFHILIMGRE